MSVLEKMFVDYVQDNLLGKLLKCRFLSPIADSLDYLRLGSQGIYKFILIKSLNYFMYIEIWELLYMYKV